MDCVAVRIAEPCKHLHRQVHRERCHVGLSHSRADLQFHVTIEGAKWPPAVALFARVDDGRPWIATAQASADGRSIAALADDATDLIEQLIGGESLRLPVVTHLR
jgi:hypothetical protein